MKVLFTHSYFLDLDPKQKKVGRPYPPLAPLYAIALLRQYNFDIALADLQFGKASDLQDHLRAEQPSVVVIYDDGFNYLAKMCLSNMRAAVFQMIQLAKASAIPVIISSSDATDNQELYFQQGVDFLIEGEAEYTLLELLQNFIKKDFKTIKGLVHREQGILVKNFPRAVSRNLDDLPMPAWDLIDFRPYRDVWQKSSGYFSINMVTTRGCPYKCNWCAKPIYGNRYNSHSAERIVKEMLALHELAGMDHIWFADDIFGLKPGYLEEFVMALREHRINIPFKIQSRADLMTDLKHVNLLAKAGCTEVWLGVESGSQKILDAMDKGITLEQVRLAVKLLKTHQIKIGFFMQYGYVGETINDILLSLSFLNELQPDDLGISISYPLPGTTFYEKVRHEMTEKKNWAHSDDLLHLFKGTYSPAFYQLLQKYTHYQFRAGQSIRLLQQFVVNRTAMLLPYYYLRTKIIRKQLRHLYVQQTALPFPL